MHNLPAGVTSREIDALCARAYKSDHLFDCSRCLQEIHDYTEISHHRVNGQGVCGECVHTCAGGCGLWLNDDDCPAKVYETRFREHENDGKLSEPHCPKCAADWLIGVFVGEAGIWDSDDYATREEIEALLWIARALPNNKWADAAPTPSQPVKEAHDAA